MTNPLPNARPPAEADPDAEKRLWANGRAECPCSAEAISTFHIQADTEHLECPRCGKMTMRIVEVIHAEMR